MLLFILIRLCRADTFKVGEAYAGFQCFAINDATDGRIFHLRHIKTGAELIAVKTDDEEESFNISFKTPSKNSHGTAHALEHILLEYPSRKYDFGNGRDAYNLLRLFDINAFTTSSVTYFVFSSRHPQDFNEALRIYMDRVLFSKFGEHPESLKSESWRYVFEVFFRNDHTSVTWALSRAESLCEFEFLKARYFKTRVSRFWSRCVVFRIEG